MTNPTSNFGWQMPTSTDLVTDLPADFEVFGQAVDTSLADLKGGTTGQVLKKNSNTDMDFVWSSDSAGMTNPMTTTGDTIYSSSGSTPARLGIGTTGQVLTVSGGVPSWATPAAGGGMTELASGTLSGTTFTLSSISQSYKTLRLVISNAYPSSRGAIKHRVNANTSSIYGQVGLRMLDTGATDAYSAAGYSSNYDMLCNTGAWEGAAGNNYIQIEYLNYKDTNAFKAWNTTFWTKTNTSTAIQGFSPTIFRNTSAITSISLECEVGSWSGGNYILYGVN